MKDSRAEEIIRKKLAELESPSQDKLANAEFLWEKLGQKMDEKPARRIRLVPHAVAASVIFLLVLFAGYYFNGQRKMEIVKVEPGSKKHLAEPALDEPTVSPDASQKKEVRQVVHQKKERKLQSNLEKSGRATKTEEHQVVVVEPDTPEPSVNSILAGIPITKMSATKTLILKRNLPVVSFDDLGKTDESPIVAKPKTQFRIGQREDGRETRQTENPIASASQSAPNFSIKIKL
ncbi:MAG: hypothetical protein WC716_03835 [Chitinophagaceae bacterium]|jgi:hypothetical protein